VDNGAVPAHAPKSNNRRRRRTTLREYEALLDSHRRDLGAHARAAEAAGVSYNTALKAYRSGFGPEMPAITKVIACEMAEARGLLGREAVRRDAEKRAVRRHALQNVEQRLVDGRVLAAARTNVAAVLALSGNLLARALQLAQVFVAGIGDPQWRPSPRELVDILRAISCIAQQGVATEERVRKMEACVLGEQESTAGSATPDMTFAEAVEQLQSAERTLNRPRRRATMRASTDGRAA
jgi:hypothetical protein